MTENVSAGYRLAEAVTRREARNFYYGIRLLPADKRAALCAVYALARRIDDVGDGPGSTDYKIAHLAVVREQLAALDTVTDPVLAALADSATRFPIPLGAFSELLDGV